MRVVRGGADELGQDRPGSIVLTLADALGISLQSLMDDADLVGGTRGYAVIEAVGSAIEDLSSTVPVLVVVEDLQWADELSVQGLASLVRRIGPLPVALVVTRRPTPRPALVERIFTGQPLEIEHLHLPGLDDAAVTAMVATLTGVPPGRNLSRRVAGASGNPLYVTELIRALDDNGEIGVHGGLAEVDDPALPASLRATVLGRLAALSERSVEMLRLASLLGRAFTLTDLATISGRRVVDVATDLRSIVDAAILTGESDTLSFRHDLIRDSVYDDILPAIRVDLHAAAGRALAAAGAPTVQVARQMELGARPGDLVAVEWLVRAGAESLSFDYAGAITMFQQALSVAGDRWPGRTGVEAAQLEPLALCGRVDEARSIAHALLDRGVDAQDEFVVQRALGVVAAASGDLAAAVSETKTAAALPGAPADEAIVLTCLEANLALLTGRAVDEVRLAGERTLAYAASCTNASADVACVGHHTLALTDAVDGHYERATEHARASRRLLFDNGLPTRGYLIPDLWEATFLMLADRLDDALERLSGRQRPGRAAGAAEPARPDPRCGRLRPPAHRPVGRCHVRAGSRTGDHGGDRQPRPRRGLPRDGGPHRQGSGRRAGVDRRAGGRSRGAESGPPPLRRRPAAVGPSHHDGERRRPRRSARPARSRVGAERRTPPRW